MWNKIKSIIAIFTFLIIDAITFAQTIIPSNTNREEIQYGFFNNNNPLISYQGTIEVGYGIGLGAYGKSNIKLNIINSIRKSYYSMGIGVGLRLYSDSDIILPFFSDILEPDFKIPVFFDFRRNFSNKIISPYLALGIGCIIDFSVYEKPFTGLFLNPSCGISWKISNRTALIIGIVYEFNRMRQQLWDIDHHIYYKINSNSLGINIGISF
jgi:hypothetical protein